MGDENKGTSTDFVADVPEDVVDLAPVIWCDPQAAAPSEGVTETERRLTDGRRVHDRCQLFDVFGKDLVVQGLVAALEGSHTDVFLERIVALRLEMLPGTADLTSPVGHLMGEHPIEVEQLSLLLGECGPFVEQGIGQEAGTPLPNVRHDPFAVRASLDAVFHESLRCDPRCRFGQLIVRRESGTG